MNTVMDLGRPTGQGFTPGNFITPETPSRMIARNLKAGWQTWRANTVGVPEPRAL